MHLVSLRNFYFSPLDGVVLVDPEYLKDRRVFGHVLAAFRYGREDLDVLGESLKQGCQICLGKTYQNW
jgi:beta-arrestin